MEENRFMELAIYLASKAEAFEVKSNPKVGAVLVYEGRIIGQGYHMRLGEAHAEVNCLESVPTSLKYLIPKSTMYVTLEPCAHQGKTPSCAKRLAQEQVKRVVIGTLDPFPKVAGKGCQILQDAGIEISVGLLEKQCREVSKVFMTNQIAHRPYVTLKWAESADGYVDIHRCADQLPARISTPYIQLLTHKLRAEHDAIIVGKGTILMDHPQLNNRLYPGLPSPEVYIMSRSSDALALILKKRNWHVIQGDKPLYKILGDLYRNGINSLLVEGGPTILNSFIGNGLWDIIRREVSNVELKSGIKAPSLGSDLLSHRIDVIDQHQLIYYTPLNK